MQMTKDAKSAIEQATHSKNMYDETRKALDGGAEPDLNK